jgi:hypothetical protein
MAPHLLGKPGFALPLCRCLVKRPRNIPGSRAADDMLTNERSHPVGQIVTSNTCNRPGDKASLRLS